MLIRPELQALRSDNAPQRRAQAELHRVLAQWRSTGGGAGIETAMVSFARGEPLAALLPLARLFDPGDGAAARLARDLTGRFAAALASQQWGQVPLPGRCDEVIASLVLASAGNAALVLQAIDGTALTRRPAMQSVSFTPSESYDHVLAGSAHGRWVELASEAGQRANLAVAPCALEPGQITTRAGARQALLIDVVPATLVTLKLQRRPLAGAVTREFRLSDGTLAHQAAGGPRDSRFELTAALLGRMGRADAAPLLGAMAEEQGGASLRWQALKECLGLDSAQGFAALSRIAAQDGDPLAQPALAMRHQLIATYPELAGAAPCPA